MTFQNLITGSLILLLLRGFVVGPFEPGFLIVVVLSLIIVKKWSGGRRVVGLVILPIGVAGFAYDIWLRIDEQRYLQQRQERILKKGS